MKIRQWFAHYFLGLLAQSWNGAIATVAGIVAVDSTGKLKDGITFDLIWQTFVVALGIRALIYFQQNPFPVLKTESITSTTITEDTKVTTTKTDTIPPPTT